MDPPAHRDHRTWSCASSRPKRLKENEEFVWRLADRQIDEFLQRRASASSSAATPTRSPCSSSPTSSACPRRSTTEFRTALARRPHDAAVGSTKDTMSHNPLEWLYDRFSRYIEDRRLEPRHDVLTALATTTFPNGELPEVIDVVRVAANVFAAGQETTVRLLGTTLQLIGERPGSAAAAARAAASSSPTSWRRRSGSSPRSKATSGWPAAGPTVAGVDIPAGATLMVVNGAGEPRSPPLRGPGGVPGRPRQRPRAPRLRTRRPQLPGRVARPHGDQGEHRAAPRPHGGDRHLRGPSRPPGPAGTSTCRPTSSGA